MTSDDIPADIREAAREAFAGRPRDPVGALALSGDRSAWRALDDALAYVIPEVQRGTREQLLDWTRYRRDEELSLVRLSCGHAKLAIRNLPPEPGLVTGCRLCGPQVTIVREITAQAATGQQQAAGFMGGLTAPTPVLAPGAQEADPLSVRCGACLADPGQPCRSTSSDELRPQPHRLRGMAAHKRLTRCEACQGAGWRPEDAATADTRPAEDTEAR